MVIVPGAKGLKQGDKASLLTPVYTTTQKLDMCVKFWYHMEGVDMGTLNVYVKSDKLSGWGSPAFTASGKVLILRFCLCYISII